MTVEIYSPLGANVTRETVDAEFKLGTRAAGQDNRSFVYVQASGSIAIGDAVGIDEDFQAVSLTTTTAAAMHAVGWASEHAFTNDYYGFVTVSGADFDGLVADNSSADAPLYTTATAGYLSTDSSTANPIKVAGVTCIAVTSGGGLSKLIATSVFLSE